MPKATTTRKPRNAKPKSKAARSASDTIKDVAKQCKVSYRKARRVARDLGLGVGQGSSYNVLNKTQVNKLTKALSA